MAFITEIRGLVYSVLTKISVLSVVLAVTAGTVFSDLESPQLAPLHPLSLDAAGIRALQQAEPSLNGQGVTIAAICRSMTYLNGRPQNDYRFNMRHHSLADADVLFEDDSDGRHGISPHSTAVAGILIGLDAHARSADGDAFIYHGVSPYASVDVYEFWRFAALRVFARKSVEADIITLSLGDMFEDWWTRGVERLAAEEGTVIVAAIGNGQAARDPLLYPAAGANAIGVGVVDSMVDADGNLILGGFAVPTSRHSSQGPTHDLRSKPDLVAPGTAIVPDAYTPNGYTVVANASSLAAPMTAGVAALLLQYANQDDALGAAMAEAPTNSIIKAVLMNSARKLPYWHKGQISEEDDIVAPLDRLQGAGALDATAALEQFRAGRQPSGQVLPQGWDSAALTDDDALYYYFEAADPTEMLTATLTWNRHFEDAYPFALRDEQSDLRLELWGIDAAYPDQRVLLDVSDSPVDTVEHLWTPLSSEFTRYAIAVRFSPEAVLPRPDAETFALAWSVGPDVSLGHPLWGDLNGDGKIDPLDSFIKILLEGGHLHAIGPEFYEQALKLSPERAELLTTHWHRWKSYLDAE